MAKKSTATKPKSSGKAASKPKSAAKPTSAAKKEHNEPLGYAEERIHQLEKLPLDKIKLTVRERDFQAEKVHQLKLSIQTDGLINPITVRLKAKGAYVLETGRHRYEAYKQLSVERPEQYSEIPALIIEKGDSKRAELAENLFRNELSVLEQSEHIQKYLELSGEPVMKVLEDVKGKLKHSRTQFFRLKRIAEGISPNLRLRIKQVKGRDLVNNTRQLEYLSELKDSEMQEKIISLIEETPTLTVMEAHNQLNNADGSKGNPGEATKLSSVKIPVSTHQSLSEEASQRNMKPEEFLAVLLESALKALQAKTLSLPEVVKTKSSEV